jgi:hypothetical protein
MRLRSRFPLGDYQREFSCLEFRRIGIVLPLFTASALGGPNTIGIVLLAWRRASAAAMSGSCARTLRQAELDDDVLPFDVAQSLPESGIDTSATSWSLRGDDRVYL